MEMMKAENRSYKRLKEGTFDARTRGHGARGNILLYTEVRECSLHFLIEIYLLYREISCTNLVSAYENSVLSQACKIPLSFHSAQNLSLIRNKLNAHSRSVVFSNGFIVHDTHPNPRAELSGAYVLHNTTFVKILLGRLDFTP